jgi:Flp pilus assembly protein protease CpaA
VNLHAVAELTVVAGAACAGLHDARTGRIPNALTLAVAVVGFALALVGGDIATAACGAAAAGGALGALFVLTAGRGLGLGDVKLAVGLGAGLGPASALAALAAAFIAGGAIAVVLVAVHRAKPGDTLRFGPFLAFGTLAAVGAKYLHG